MAGSIYNVLGKGLFNGEDWNDVLTLETHHTWAGPWYPGGGNTS